MDGAIVGLQGGQDVINSTYHEMKDAGVPICGIWMQDWVGTHNYTEGERLNWNWQLNTTHYPKWNQMISQWSVEGVKPLIYLNPYIANISGSLGLRQNQFEEGIENGYFVKQKDGSPYIMKSVSIEMAIVDLTNPEAWEWQKNNIKQNLI